MIKGEVNNILGNAIASSWYLSYAWREIYFRSHFLLFSRSASASFWNHISSGGNQCLSLYHSKACSATFTGKCQSWVSGIRGRNLFMKSREKLKLKSKRPHWPARTSSLNLNAPSFILKGHQSYSYPSEYNHLQYIKVRDTFVEWTIHGISSGVESAYVRFGQIWTVISFKT